MVAIAHSSVDRPYSSLFGSVCRPCFSFEVGFNTSPRTTCKRWNHSATYCHPCVLDAAAAPLNLVVVGASSFGTRLAQGPDGQWVPPLESIAADGGLRPVTADGVKPSSPRALDVIINVLAVSACVLGPYMAMTGLR